MSHLDIMSKIIYSAANLGQIHQKKKKKKNPNNDQKSLCQYLIKMVSFLPEKGMCH
jgi:hypothetical protein